MRDKPRLAQHQLAHTYTTHKKLTLSSLMRLGVLGCASHSVNKQRQYCSYISFGDQVYYFSCAARKFLLESVNQTGPSLSGLVFYRATELRRRGRRRG